MKQELVSLLEQLCLARGISGQEQEVARLIFGMLKKSRPDVLQIDSMGNITATRKGKGLAPSLLLAAHLDEVGAIVNEVCDNGLLRFKTVGCVNASALPSTRVRVGDAEGTFTAPPGHTHQGSISPEDIFIDIGAESGEEAAAMGAAVGSAVTFDTGFSRLTENRICSRVIDNRIGCAILIRLMETLDYTPDGDVTVAFSVREETTMTGAAMIVDRVKPDWIIAVDTVPVKNVGAGELSIDIGKGPVFQLAEGVMHAFVGNFVTPSVKKAILEAAGNTGIPYQLCAEVGGWTTDGATLHTGNGGTPCGYVSIPRRNAHSASEVCDIRDSVHALELLRRIVCDMGKVSLDFI